MRSAPIHPLVTSVVVLMLTACGAERLPPTDPAGSPALQRGGDDPPSYSDWSPPVNLGPPVNTPFVEQAASISRDGLSLYFQCRGCPDMTEGSLPGSSDIYVSRRASVDGPWGTPMRLGPDINTIHDDVAPRLSLDGHRLFFASNRPTGHGGRDLYVSRRRDARADDWSSALNLGPDINTDIDEIQPDPFEDETGVNVLYYAAGPILSGGTNIYVSTLRPDGTYGPGEAVTELNSPAADRQPAIRRDGLEIFFASNRSPGGSGGLDLWVSTRATTRDPWSSPVNLGAVVNSAVIDARPALSFDGTTLYFQSTRAGAVGCAEGVEPCVFDLWMTTRRKITGRP